MSKVRHVIGYECVGDTLRNVAKTLATLNDIKITT